MTDNRTTELRRKLTELGKSYSTIDGKHKNTAWHVGELTWWYDEDTETGKTVLFTPKEYDLTPEQAIAATLGSGTCHMHFIDEYEYASGEEEYLCECSECGSTTWEPAHDLPLYCRKCGRKVEQ